MSVGGQLWDNFGTTLGQLWDNFGTTLRQLWDKFGSTQLKGQPVKVCGK